MTQRTRTVRLTIAFTGFIGRIARPDLIGMADGCTSSNVLARIVDAAAAWFRAQCAQERESLLSVHSICLCCSVHLLTLFQWSLDMKTAPELESISCRSQDAGQLPRAWRRLTMVGALHSFFIGWSHSLSSKGSVGAEKQTRAGPSFFTRIGSRPCYLHLAGSLVITAAISSLWRACFVCGVASDVAQTMTN